MVKEEVGLTNEHLEELEAMMKDKDSKIAQLSGYASSAIFNQQQDNNLIVWQLELDNILERIEHLLKGDVVKEDESGNVVYTPPKDTGLITLNTYGVQLIMSTISFYLSRNTILSKYMPDRIFEILNDLGNELADVVYINYEKMGMDTTEKKSRSELLVISILHTLESAYNRALDAGERESLRSARIVTQTQPLGQSFLQTQPRRHRGGFLNPKNWKV